MLFIPKEEVGIASLFAPLNDVLHLVILTLVILHIWKSLLDFLQEREQTLYNEEIRLNATSRLTPLGRLFVVIMILGVV